MALLRINCLVRTLYIYPKNLFTVNNCAVFLLLLLVLLLLSVFEF